MDQAALAFAAANGARTKFDRNPTLGTIYVHSRDDERAASGERPAREGLKTKSLR